MDWEKRRYSEIFIELQDLMKKNYRTRRIKRSLTLAVQHNETHTDALSEIVQENTNSSNNMKIRK